MSDLEWRFTEIFERRTWGGPSPSGSGSTLENTRVVRAALPGLVRELGVRVLLDVPCGDFGWLSTVDLGDCRYIGCDVVEGVLELARGHVAPERSFHHLDLRCDRLPRADLVLCRDCLGHFSLEDALVALRNVGRSGASFLLTTTFPGRVNRSINTGEWYPINLQQSPFNLPSPLKLINEESREEQGAYTDKSLGLWRVEDVASVHPWEEGT